jgi:hypothetical protein
MIMCFIMGELRESMQQRPPADDVTRSLETTSDKIRALSRAGYDRTEISKLLNIRYQHVRKVLIDAGITGGLRRQVEAEREPVTVDAEPASREDLLGGATSCGIRVYRRVDPGRR